MDVQLSEDQQRAVQAVERWWQRGGQEFRLGGLAGTGKTTIVGALVATLGVQVARVAYCAPTGKAAQVLSRRLHGTAAASTVHRLMYKPREHHCDDCPAGEVLHDLTTTPCHGMRGSCGCGVSFAWEPPDPVPALVVVDEASMVDSSMHNDLRALRCPVLYVGDHGQLPPVRSGGGLMDEAHLDVRLERVHRQLAHSHILKAAMLARQGSPVPYGTHSAELQHLNSMRELGAVNTDDTLLLCYTNKERMQHNAAVRGMLGLPAHRPVVGDKLICLRNNWQAGVANGSTGTVLEIEPWRNGKFYRVVVQLHDEARTYVGSVLAEQFNSAETILTRDADVWTYGYCLTVHKAQGSEAPNVVVFEGPSLRYMKEVDRRRWRYTAYTRAKGMLTIVG